MTTEEHIRALREALEAARACILIDRESVAECHTAPDGMMDDDGEEALAELDAVLSQIEAAMPSLAALDEARRDAERLRQFAEFVERGCASGAIKAKPVMDMDPNAEQVRLVSLAEMARAALTPGA